MHKYAYAILDLWLRPQTQPLPIEERTHLRRALLVTSCYAPALMADMHRVRHLSWELPKLGWSVEVLTPNVQFQNPKYFESDSAIFFTRDAVIHEVVPQYLQFFNLLKIRSAGWRALKPMAEAGAKVLRRQRFDLIYISTANFNLFCLGSWWQRGLNIPFVLDYQDPWVRDTIDYTTTPSHWKRKLTALLSRRMERYALQHAAGIVSVSPVYLEELRCRYGNLRCLNSDYCDVIPFAGSETDIGLIAAKPSFNRGEFVEIVYSGAGGSIMAKSFSTLCTAVAEVRRSDPALLTHLKIRLFGTYPYWQTSDPKPLQEIACRFGLADIVEEFPPRITYKQSIELIGQSSGLLILGVDDVGYMPSKLFNYALSGKPLLACLRAKSPAARMFVDTPSLGHLLTFGEGSSERTLETVNKVRKFLLETRRGEHFERKTLIRNYLAPEMAVRHAALFERICKRATN